MKKFARTGKLLAALPGRDGRLIDAEKIGGFRLRQSRIASVIGKAVHLSHSLSVYHSILTEKG